ncbi:hypothetical protein EDC04DRAFT_2581994 [Pisolithus marmoratus]|nr:hypothetical protein EDC04DRAFT_2581994 [Pisolithus marmoratus]
MTVTYTFTNYCSQGQTIPTVLINIATPPTGGLNLFNLYVALSWSSGHLTIQLLHNFDNKIFQASHSTELLAEDDRLEELNKNTLVWGKEWGMTVDRHRNKYQYFQLPHLHTHPFYTHMYTKAHTHIALNSKQSIIK